MTDAAPPRPDGRPVVAVVGGGIAGLAVAWELVTAPGAGPAPVVHVLEAGSRVGGKLRAAEFAGSSVDLAADAFLARRPEATGLCRELGLDDELVPVGASGAALWVRGRLRSMPDGLQLGIPTRWLPLARSGILSPGGALRAGLDLVRPHAPDPDGAGDRSVGEIVSRRLGRQVAERLADPLIGGIHAGSADGLSAAATFPVLLAADRQRGSLMRRLGRPPAPAQQPPAPPDGAAPPPPMFWSLDGGTARLAAELADALVARGATVHTGVAVESLDRGRRGGPTWEISLAGNQDVPGARDRADGGSVLTVDGAVLAVPGGQAAGLLAPHAPVAAGLLGSLAYASVAVITLALRSGAVRAPMVGTGFLVPRTSEVLGRRALVTGCTYLSRKWPHLARPGDELVRLSVGRFGDTRPDELSDDELVRAATTELDAIVGVDGEPEAALVTRWDGAFPQYPAGHLERVARILEDVTALGGLSVAGAAYHGVGIPACVGSGRSAARDVLRTMPAAPVR